MERDKSRVIASCSGKQHSVCRETPAPWILITSSAALRRHSAMQCNATEQKKTEEEGNHWEAARYHNLLEDMLVRTVKEPLNLDLMEEGDLKVEKDIRKWKKDKRSRDGRWKCNWFCCKFNLCLCLCLCHKLQRLYQLYTLPTLNTPIPSPVWLEVPLLSASTWQHFSK